MIKLRSAKAFPFHPVSSVTSFSTKAGLVDTSQSIAQASSWEKQCDDGSVWVMPIVFHFVRFNGFFSFSRTGQSFDIFYKILTIFTVSTSYCATIL